MKRYLVLCWIVLQAVSLAPGARAQTSRAIWEKRFVHAPAVAPVLSGDTLWVVGTERRIHSIAASTGKRHWRRNLPGAAITAVLPRGDLLLIGLAPPNRILLALDRRDGRQRWTARLDGIPIGMDARGEGVVVAQADGNLQAFALRDGSLLWKRRLMRPLAGIARAGADRLVILGRSDSLWCVVPRSGSVSWTAGTRGVHAAPPVVIDSAVVSIALDGEIVTRRIGDGVETARASARAPQIVPPAHFEGVIATVATGGEIETFELPGLEKGWMRETGETVSCGAAGWGSWWVVPALSGRVLAVTRARGVDAWDLKLRAAIYLLPAVNREYMALVDERGRVMLYRLDRPS